MNARNGQADSWDCRPDWRWERIKAYLVEIAGATDRVFALQRLLFDQKDPFVRQALRFRTIGACVNQPAFEWAFQCMHANNRTSLLSMVKSMVVAGIPAAAIAQELGTSRSNIITVEKMFFDVRRHLQNRIWLRTMIVEPADTETPTVEQSRERMWLRIAFQAGSERLLSVLRNGEDTNGESLEETAQRIETIAGRRALEYVRGLDRSGAVPCEDDLKRYLLARVMRSRESATAASDQMVKVREWGLNLVRAFEARSKEEVDAKAIDGAMKFLPVEEMRRIKHEAEEQHRRRAELAGGGNAVPIVAQVVTGEADAAPPITAES